MNVLAVSFFVTLITSFIVLHYDHLHSKFTGDSNLDGIQKFHTKSVPRIGGLGIYIGTFIALLAYFFWDTSASSFGLILQLTSLPAFLSGLLEDVTKKIGVKFRLLSCMIAALIAGYYLDGWLNSVQILGIDNLMLAYPVIAISITCFAVAGVSNAFNIIDGYNGLSSMVAVIILAGLSYVAFQVGDMKIMIAALAMIGALLGFLVWNYPRGLIFLGDGGAYLIGFWIAEISVLLTSRHSEISKWFPLLLCIYPIFETIFTIYRRLIIKRAHPGMPDASHLHQLIYRRIVRWGGNAKNPQLQLYRNSMTSPYLWVLTMLAVIPAIIFWRHHLILKGLVILFGATYIWLYWAIVRHKIPKYLIPRK